MLDKDKLNDYTGLNSWFEFYRILENDGHAGLENLRIIKQGPRKSATESLRASKYVINADEDWSISMDQVRAEAFLEIYAQLPTNDEVKIISRLIYGAGLPGKIVDTCQGILYKIPRKDK